MQHTYAEAIFHHGHNGIVIQVVIRVWGFKEYWEKTIQVIFDQEVADSEYYGCSDGTTTGYMKVKTEDILTKILPHSRHKYKVIGI